MAEGGRRLPGKCGELSDAPGNRAPRLPEAASRALAQIQTRQLLPAAGE